MHALWFATGASGQSRAECGWWVLVTGPVSRRVIDECLSGIQPRPSEQPFFAFPLKPESLPVIESPSWTSCLRPAPSRQEKHRKGLSQFNSIPRVHLCYSRVSMLIDLINNMDWFTCVEQFYTRKLLLVTLPPTGPLDPYKDRRLQQRKQKQKPETKQKPGQEKPK